MRQASGSQACYHTHSHDEFSFGVIDAGQAYYSNQNQKYTIGKGATVTINPGDAHACNPQAERWSYRMLFVDTDWVGKRQQEMLASHSEDYRPFPKRYTENPASFQHFSALFECLREETNPLVAESQLIAFLSRYFATTREARNTRETPDLVRVGRAKERIMDQLGSKLTLAELSQHSGLSPYHLIRSYQKAYGQSPHAFQLDQRIIKAKRLLQQGQRISEIASSLGFADQSHFQRHFKKRIAVTPGCYRAFFV